MEMKTFDACKLLNLRAVKKDTIQSQDRYAMISATLSDDSNAALNQTSYKGELTGNFTLSSSFTVPSGNGYLNIACSAIISQ